MVQFRGRSGVKVVGGDAPCVSGDGAIVAACVGRSEDGRVVLKWENNEGYQIT